MNLARSRSLGRGLASLIPDTALGEPTAERSDRPIVRVVPIDEIRANPHQPRERFNPSELASLSESIRQHGVLSPLVVRKEEGRYVLVAGERRLRAAALAGLKEVPVLVREVDAPSQQLELALVENLQRADLDPIEAARGYQRLIDEYKYTQEEVAQRVGKERPTVANALRLLKLPDGVLDALRDGKLSAGHARALLPLAEREELKCVVGQVITEDLSVRATERLVARIVSDADSGAAARSCQKRAFSYALDLLTDSLQTHVSIRERKDGGGSVIIGFSSGEELDRIVTRIGSTR